MAHLNPPVMKNGVTQMSHLAITSLAFSCASLIIWPFGFIPGIILGFMAISGNSSNPQMKGRGIAIAGVVVGIVFAVAFIPLLLLALVAFLTRSAVEPFVYPIF
jgi:hypothetical protein